MTDYKKQGKANRAAGLRFELKVRKDLEDKGWIVDKWSNNVDLHDENSEEVSGRFGGPFGKLIPAKHKFRGQGIPMAIGTGFPDFVAFKKDITNHPSVWKTYAKRKDYVSYEVIGVEVKSNGLLKKEEKEKCDWLIKNNIFSKILIASKGLKRGEIIYKEWQ